MESNLVKSKLEEFFWEWISTPEAQKLIRQSVQFAKGDSTKLEDAFPNPHFTIRGSPSRGPSPPGSPSRSLHHASASEGTSSGASPPSPLSPSEKVSSPQAATKETKKEAEPTKFERPTAISAKLDFEKPKIDLDLDKRHAGTSKVIPRFWWPKRQQPLQVLPADAREKIHDCFVKQDIVEIRTHQHMESIVTDVFGLSKYFTVPIFHKVKVFYDIADASAKSRQALLAPSKVPITEQMLVGWCNGKIQVDDPVLSFFNVVKSEHNEWIEREDFSLFLTTILLTHPGLDFLRETQEFQDRYADTVISRIFFVYDRKDVGRIYLSDLRRYKPSVIETWKQLADHDDIKMVRDYFSYEHFYVIYCTFWELDSDHDFLLDKDDLLKYDGHALSRRAIDRIFSEIPTKFTSAVPGRMDTRTSSVFYSATKIDRQTAQWSIGFNYLM
jgi:serine/threonine-protein phosphatase 2A regulatory subunit B''